ncbi:MAG: hypothetical protein PHW31_01055 [Candidatus Pacebacteria bacterium]|nr:hypothetical protein [Candidatus Paceibacterota bacterium]
MKTKWSITKLAAAASIGAMFLVFGVLGSIVYSIVGFPGASAIITSFTTPIMFALVVLLIRKFGAGTIAGLVYYTLGLPLGTGGGPGFLPKILVGLVAGIIADAILLSLKNKEKIAAPAVAVASQLIIGLMVAGLCKLFSVPGIDKFISLFLKPITFIAAIIIGIIDGLVAYLIYNRLKNTAVVKRIQG